MKNTFCDEDCFNCKFNDCMLPEQMCSSLHPRPTEAEKAQRKKDYDRAYALAHKEKILKYQAEYRKRKGAQNVSDQGKQERAGLSG